LFPELLPHIQEAWEQSSDGAEYVLQGYEHIDANRFNSRALNLRTPVFRAIRTAGLTPMPRVAEDLGGEGGEVVEGDAIALTFSKLCRFRKN
jgi:hypothetical protein